jgi:hypothetical protein
MDFRNRCGVAGSSNSGAHVFSFPLRRSFHLGMAMSSTMNDHHDERRFTDFCDRLDGHRLMDVPSCTRDVGSGNSHESLYSRFLQRRKFPCRTRVIGSCNGRFSVAIDRGENYRLLEGSIHRQLLDGQDLSPLSPHR